MQMGGNEIPDIVNCNLDVAGAKRLGACVKWINLWFRHSCVGVSKYTWQELNVPESLLSKLNCDLDTAVVTHEHNYQIGEVINVWMPVKWMKL